MQGPWERYGGQAAPAQGIPQVIEGPPREAPLHSQETPAEVRIDQGHAAAAPYAAPAAAASVARTTQQTRQGDTRGVNFTDENTLRQQFLQLPEVRRYNEVVPIYISATEAADTTAGDLNLTYAFGKVMDPGSVVREAEQVMVQNTSPIADRLHALMSEIDRTGRLQPATRAALMDELRNRRLALAQSYAQQRNQYITLAQRYGFNPNGVVGEHPAEPYAARERADRAGASVPTAGLPPGTREVESADAPARAVSPRDLEFGREVQALFDSGGSRTQLNELAQRHGYAPYGVDLDRAIAYRGRGGRGARILPPESMTEAGARATEMDAAQGQMGQGDIVQHGAMLGLGDEAAGVAGAIGNVVTSPFTGNLDPVGAYQTERDADEIRLREARDRAGTLGTIEEIGGGLASGNPTAALSRTFPTLLSRIGAGSRAGAEVGLLSGFGHGRGPSGSAIGAVEGAAGGALIGGAIPVIGAGGNALYGFARTATGRNPNLSRQVVARAIEEDANTPRIVGQQMQAARDNGVPYMLADSGDNVRGLLAASTRAPGTGRTIARDALDVRQAGLGERVAGAIGRDLGPVSNPHEIGEELITQAQTAAAPLYERAYARPGADTFARRISGFMGRPAMQRAMARARAIAQEEGRDPDEMGLIVRRAPRGSVLEGERAPVGTSRAPQGSILAGEQVPTVSQNPTWQTFDYLKRGLDDVLQAQPRDPATGRLILNEGTRAIQSTLSGFLRVIDKANPEYAAARAAWAGPVRAREAMDVGRRALNLNADDLVARTRGMSANEQEFLLLGVRRAMAERVANLGDTANVTHALLGTGRKRALMLRLFGGRQGFDRFVETMQAEQAGFQTYRTARQGSPTAANIQDDTAINVATAAADIVTTGTPFLTGLRIASKLGGGRASRQAQQEIAALLSETDPARLAEVAAELRREAARLRIARGRAARRAPGYGVAGGTGVGRAVGD